MTGGMHVGRCRVLLEGLLVGVGRHEVLSQSRWHQHATPSYTH